MSWEPGELKGRSPNPCTDPAGESHSEPGTYDWPDYRPCKPNTAGIPLASESERLGMEVAEAQRRGDESRRA